MRPGTETLFESTRAYRTERAARPDHIVRPDAGQESVWDYPRPPRVENSARLIRVEFDGVKLAESRRAVRVCETASPPVYYVPPADVLWERMAPAEGESVCEWKGLARYYTALSGANPAGNCAWSYPDPFPGFEAIRDYVAFYPGRVECYLDRERVQPQPGGFYGGWVTSGIAGPFKGEPGTEDW